MPGPGAIETAAEEAAKWPHFQIQNVADILEPGVNALGARAFRFKQMWAPAPLAQRVWLARRVPVPVPVRPLVSPGRTQPIVIPVPGGRKAALPHCGHLAAESLARGRVRAL